jgi:hypothetical protein
MKKLAIIALFFTPCFSWAYSNYTYIYPNDAQTVATSSEIGDIVLSKDFYTFTSTSTILSGTLHSSNLGNGANLYVVSGSNIFRYVDKQSSDLETYKLAIYPYIVKSGDKLRCDKDSSLRFFHCRVVFVPYNINNKGVNIVDLSTTTVNSLNLGTTSTTSSTTAYISTVSGGDVLVASFLLLIVVLLAIDSVIFSLKDRSKRYFTGNNSVDGKETYEL